MKFRIRKPTLWYKIMKITFSQILIAVVLSSFAYSNPLKAQDVLNKTVNMSLNNVTLMDVVNYLEKNNDIKFIYSKNSIDVSKKISVNYQNQPLKTVLDGVFKTNGIDYEILKDRIILGKASDKAVAANSPGVVTEVSGNTANAFAAAIPVTGKVVDESGAPVIGASVLEKGTTNGITTDINGLFKLNVGSTQSVLVIQYIGYTSQEMPVGSQTNFTITLKEAVKGLNEVVVIGYGTQSKAVTTGAISGVKAADLQDQQVTRIDDALQGRVSGVSVVQSSGAPGSAPTIRVRGITSINVSDPLYVIDGILVDNGGIDNINPNDIESIDVLKDASAAIYGSRAANGVILVTTKKGKKGPATVSYNGYVGFQAPVSKVQLTNATQYATLRNESVTNDGGVAPFANPSSFGTGTNWQNAIFSNSALIQNHNLSLSGANDNATYYTSFGYLDQKGIVEPAVSDYKKFNFTTNTTYKVKKWLTIGENFTYTYTHSQNGFNTNSVFGGPLSSALNLDPLTPVLQLNPASSPNPNDYNNQYAVRNGQGQLYGISNYVGQEITNPLAYIQTIQGNYNFSTNLLGSAFAELSPIAGLKIRSQISAKQAYYGSDSFTPLYYLNSSTSNQSSTSQYEENDRNLSWNIDNTATYTHSFGKNNFTALIGQSAQQESASGIGGTFLGEPINSFSQASPNFPLPSANKIANGFDNQPVHLASLFGRLTYDYDQKYLFTGIIRHDGSSKFGSNNIYGTFPSAEAGYVLTKEDWFPKNSFVDFLKVRGSYGVVGNELSLAAFQYAETISGGRNAVFGSGSGENVQVGYSPNAPANPNLQWERTQTADLGFDATLFHNLTVNLDVYRKLTKGMLETLQLPTYAGFPGQPYANVGNMVNKGIELNLNYANKIGDLHYNVGGNISYNNNKVTYLGSQIQYLTVGTVQSSNYEIGRTSVGQPVGEFYGFQELGVFHSQAEINNYKNAQGQLIQPNAKPGDFKWADLNGDGKIDASDRKFLGNPNPPFTYGVNINANYKQFDLKIFGQGVWGNQIYQAYRRLDIPTANYPIAALQAWTPSDPSSNYPRLSDSDPNNNFKNPSNFYLQSGAYFRIKTLQLGYTIPASWAKAADVQRVRFYISSNNLATITGYKGYDPEISGGIDMGIYPQARTFMAGLDVTL
ncbi:MAG: SusC/RagA family TonB-linked outer membrane protein [Mucilaginibacter sp.]|jgi:TonB-linked SusC/RagA family outer membrane protein|nr:SusC/RagA family TonB-linked outer membrane protein [Mucilaginibacter sp.]